MKQYHLEELIDAFLKRKLSETEAATLKELIASDPKIAEMVGESTETYRFLQYLKYLQIRNQLKEVDKQEFQSNRNFHIRNRIYAAVILILGIVTGWIWLIQYFNPQNLAQKKFEPIVFEKMIDSTYAAEDIFHLHSANEFFQKRDFQNASRLLSPYTQQGRYSHHAKWNVLMCRLALSGPDELWKTDMKKFLAIPSNPFSVRGNKLLQLVNSFIYGFVTGNSPATLTAFKPRLI